MYLFSTGTVQVATITSPTLNFVPGRGLRLGISFDAATAQILTLVPADYKAQNGIWTGKKWSPTTRDGLFHADPRPARLSYLEILDGGSRGRAAKNCGESGWGKTKLLGPPESFHQQRDLR